MVHSVVKKLKRNIALRLKINVAGLFDKLEMSNTVFYMKLYVILVISIFSDVTLSDRVSEGGRARVSELYR